MNALVADVGNTRMKWGLCSDVDPIRVVALPLDDVVAWQGTLDSWSLPGRSHWTLAGTQPDRRDALAGWLRERGHLVRTLSDYRELPIRVAVDFPERVGIDRLLNAVAVRRQVPSGTSTIVIDAGSAVTVDRIDGEGVFQGGAIFPGFRLMAKSLKDYTAQLPLVERIAEDARLPGKNTVEAIEAGIYHVLCGGIDRLVQRLCQGDAAIRIFLAGGDADYLRDLECRPQRVGSSLTLEGIRIASQTIAPGG